MTVVSGMKFNQGEGAIISDEQSSSGFRKENIATKIHSLDLGEGKPFALAGGSGYVMVLQDSIVQARDFLTNNREKIRIGRDLASGFAHVFLNVKQQYLDGVLFGEFGLKERDFHAGYRTEQDGEKIPLDPSIKSQYIELKRKLNSDGELLNNSFLVLTYDERGVDLYRLLMAIEHPLPIARPSDAIGSGSEQVDDEIAYYLDNIPRDERGNINPIEGISELLYGTERASIRNPGVGGTPLVKIIKEGKVISPGENETRLAVEIVKGCRRGYLPKEFERESLDALLYRGETFESIEGKMWECTSDREGLSRMLRGYKVRK